MFYIFIFAARTKKIAKNNWDGAAKQAESDKKLDRAIGFQLTNKASSNMTECNGKRNVWVYKGGNDGASALDLNDSGTVSSVKVFRRTKQHKKQQIEKAN